MAKKAAKRPGKAKKAARMRPAPKKAAARRAPARKAAARKPGGERARLYAQLAERLGGTRDEIELRALRELAERHEPAAEALAQVLSAPAPASAPPRPVHTGSLPQRLFLLLDGRGLDGRGLPVEVLSSPTLVGSGRFCQVWVNSPQIETRHLQIVEEEGGWVVTDLGSEHGTFLGDERIQRRALQHGDELRLAGYLRLRAELR